jgi:hypothetical protein
MVKVLIYSSKEIYDSASYEGRSEADIIAYSISEYSYQMVKNRKSSFVFAFTDRTDLEKYGEIAKWRLRSHIERLEKEEWQTKENI